MLPFDLRAEAFAQALQANSAAQLIDVRTPEEFAAGHITGAKNIDINDPDFMDHVEQLDAAGSYYIYCRSGARSARACMLMQDAGIKQVHNLAGGILDWKGALEY